MKRYYENINTFKNNISKNSLRENILNPLIVQHNEMAFDITTHELRLDDLESATTPTQGVKNFKDLEDVPEYVVGRYLKVSDAGDLMWAAASGGEGSVDLKPITDRLDIVEPKVETLEATSDTHETRLASAETKISALENAPDSGSGPTPTKWYVLPLAGQSNMTGFGEIMPNLPKPNPRIMQLGIHASGTSENVESVTPTNTGYGGMFDTYRPFEDCNLQLIPSAPCLDSFHNLFYLEYAVTDESDHRRAGGLVGVGHYLAQSLLQYIPEDYGILIVNVSRGSTGFGDENNLGTYNAETMTPELAQGSTQTGGSRRWWGDGENHNTPAPYGLALYDRIKHALELNPENILLPVIWFQGESDDHCVHHYERFKNLVKYVKGKLVEDGLDNQLPTKSINDFRWFCFGSTKILYAEDIVGKDYLGGNFNHTGDWTSLIPNYDNYAYLMEDPEFITGANGESQVISARIDIDYNGDFFETVLEELKDAGNLTSIASSQPDWHFSTATLMYHQPQYIINALATYGKCLTGCVPKKWVRKVPGKVGSVTTDNVKFEYDNTMATSFDAEANQIFKLDAKTEEVTLDESVITAHTLSTAAYTEDPVYGKVANFVGNNGQRGVLDMAYTGDYTISTVVRAKGANRANDQSLFGPEQSSNTTTPIITIEKGSMIVKAFNGGSNFRISKSLVGAWKGQFNDWQHIAFTYSAMLGHLTIYVNGCLVSTITDLPHNLGFGKFNYGSAVGGKAFYGNVSMARIHTKCMTPQEINTLCHLDAELRRLA